MLFGTFSNVDVLAKEGINDIGIFCDDKIFEYYGEIDIDWVFYDENGLATDDNSVQPDEYYDTWAMGCINDAYIGCQNDTSDLGNFGNQVTNECGIQLVKRDSYRIYPDGNFTNNQNGRPTDNYSQLDWICASLISNGEANFSALVGVPFTFNFYCFDQDSFAPSLTPTKAPNNHTSN